MGQLGDTVMKPFLQDVIQFQPLLQTMQSQMMRVRGRGKEGEGGIRQAAVAQHCWLQDVVQFQPLLQTMQSQMMRVRGREEGGEGGREIGGRGKGRRR